MHLWLQALKSSGLKPEWRFLEEQVPPHNWQERERFWIAYWRRKNPKLCNVHDGGNCWPIEASRSGGRKGGRISARNVKNRKRIAALGKSGVGGRSNVENKTGWFGRSPEKHTKDSRKGALVGIRKHRKSRTGWFSRKSHFKAALASHRTCKELELGFYNQEIRKKAGHTVYALRKGIHGRSLAQMKIDGRKGGLQRGKTTAKIPGHLQKIAGLGAHTAQHLNRGVFNPKCGFCVEGRKRFPRLEAAA